MLIPITGNPSHSLNKKETLQTLTFQALLLDNVHDAIIGTDENFQVTYWNKAAETLYGWKVEEVIGKPVADLLKIQPIEQAQLVNRIDQHLATHRTRDGRAVIVEVSMLPLKDSEGQLQGYSYTIHDVTERIRLFEDLRAEKALAEQHAAEAEAARQRTAEVLESIQEIFYSVDRDWRFTYVNQKAEAAWNKQRQDMIGRVIWEIFPQALETFPYQQLIKAMQERQDLHFETHSPVLDSWIEIHAYPTADGGLAVYFRDISGRKHAEQALTLSEERFSKAFQISPNGLVISRLEDGTIVAVNERFEEIFGYSRAEMVGNQSLNLNMFADPTDRERAIQKIRQEKSLRHMEVPIRTRAGEIRQASISSEILTLHNELCLLTMVEDITERKQVERELQASEARFRQLADAMPQLVWTALPDGAVDYYNQRYLEYNGIAPEEGQNWEWGPVLHPDDLQPTIDAWLSSVNTGQMYQIEHRVRMSDGEYRWHLSRGIPARDANGQVIRWYGTATDIHDMKQAEASLAEYAERLQHSNQDLEQFAFVASHDLQEPLRKIKLFGSSIKKQWGDQLPEEAHDSFTRMLNAAERMQVMIDGLLELSRIRTRGGNFQPVALDEVVNEVLTDLEFRVQQKQAQVNVGNLPTIEADPLQIRQLFQNLIGNALKFHKPGVPPVVTIRAQSFPLLDANNVEIQIQDNGIGFESQYADQIFQPFQRLHGRSEYEGSGMGLAICQKIVDRHNGQIRASSAPGTGATFHITLPVQQFE